MPISGNLVYTSAVALGVVLGLVWLVSRLARSAGLTTRQGDDRRRLRIEESVVLDRVRRVHLLRCDGRDLLILTGGTADVALGWVPTTSGSSLESLP